MLRNLLRPICNVSSLAYAAADPAIYRPTEDSVMRLSREQGRPQSRQNARFFLPSSKLGLPNPSPEVCPPLLWFRWGHSRLRERGWVGSQLGRGNRHCDTLGKYMYFVR
jgi:hypothetical protein